MNYKTLALVIVVFAELCFAQTTVIKDITPPQTKNPNESITFSCTVVKPTGISVSWFKNELMLTMDGMMVYPEVRRSIAVDADTNTYSLTVNNLTASDSGKFKCQINVIPPVVKETDLQVTRSPSISELTEKNVQVAEGQTAVLSCKADGFPKPTVVWRRDNEELFGNKEMTYSGANLTILQVKKDDRGRYVCEANNGIGAPATKTVLLEVSFSPQISAKRPRTGQKAGYEAQLICKVTSYPPASVSWIRQDKILSNSDHYEISYLGLSNEQTESTLRLKNVASHHYGEYVCKAKNAFGEGQTTLELFEQELPNEIFTMFRKSSGHRFIGFHTAAYAVIGIITFTLFR